MPQLQELMKILTLFSLACLKRDPAGGAGEADFDLAGPGGG